MGASPNIQFANLFQVINLLRKNLFSSLQTFGHVSIKRLHLWNDLVWSWTSSQPVQKPNSTDLEIWCLIPILRFWSEHLGAFDWIILHEERVGKNYIVPPEISETKEDNWRFRGFTLPKSHDLRFIETDVWRSVRRYQSIYFKMTE